MDDVFDVRDALKGKPEAKAFARIERLILRAEAEIDRLRELESAVTVLKRWFERGET